MAGVDDPETLKTEELTALLREVRNQVRARHPQSSAGPSGVALPDLLPLLHARDAAQAKMAAIGTVNPRPGGLVNNVIQIINWPFGIPSFPNRRDVRATIWSATTF